MSAVQHPITLPAGGEQSRARRPAKHRFDVLVVGAGAVGMSVAYGLAQRGLSVCVADEGDIAFKASRGNFGLAWVQGKGAKCDDYAHWSIDAAGMWPGFAAELRQAGGVDVELYQPGGFVICTSAQEYEARVGMLTGMQQRLGAKFAFEALSGHETQARMPHASAQIAGSTYCPLDGHVSPLKLLRALFTAFSGCGGVLCPHTVVQSLSARPQGGFTARTATGTIDADKVVLAAGLGSTALASRLGLDAPLHPIRGQLLITERAEPFLRYPTLHVRQTFDGTVQIGDSKEDVGLDTGTSWDVFARIAQRAVQSFPTLAGLSMVRGWGALRVMSPDGLPIYDESLQHPGAFLVTCHSGITLAPQHAGPIAEWIATGERPDGIGGFTARRFHV